MSTLLTYGRILPQTGDDGSVWFPALESNIQRDDAHTHDGVNAPLLPPSSIDRTQVSIADSDFSVNTDGWYEASVTIPNIVDPSIAFVKFYINDTGEQVDLTWVRVSATQITVGAPQPPNDWSGGVDQLRVVLL